ncbi:MAG: hypothetical protein KY452_12215, partial [Actinobacteria bacterium]|nr:hypothetical protein [Actinomycetota bacterium]
GVPVVEHLTGLEGLVDAAFRFFAVPVKVRGLGSFPVRAFAVVGVNRQSARGRRLSTTTPEWP